MSDTLVPFAEYPWPIKAGRKAMSHQKETAKFLICNRNAYCFNDMGTGKTLSTLWAADFLMRNQKIKKVLVVCPLSTMRSAWARDLVVNIPNRTYAVAHGTKQRRTAAIVSEANFVIINHDGLKIMQDVIIKSGNFDLMIIDELTSVKNYSADRTKAAERVARAIGPVWGLTGRPTPNSPIEAFGQAKVVNPGNPFLPRFFGQFRDLVVDRINEFVWLPKDNANDVVFRIMQPAIRFTRDQCLDLPPCTVDTRFIEMSAQQKSAYETMRQKLLIEYREGTISAANAAIKLLKLTQIAAGSVKNDDGEILHLDCKPRMDELYDIFEGTPQRKLVVFAAFRADVERIVEFFTKKKVEVGFIYGSVDERQRGRLIQSFQDGSLNVLVIQPQSAAHGITLTAANTVVWYSMIPSNEYVTQANDRIIRIGQTRNQYVVYLVGSQAETRLLKLLERKQLQSNDLMESFEDFLVPESESNELEAA
jgi:SNF2 family DNA or RNA helicase